MNLRLWLLVFVVKLTWAHQYPPIDTLISNAVSIVYVDSAAVYCDQTKTWAKYHPLTSKDVMKGDSSEFFVLCDSYLRLCPSLSGYLFVKNDEEFGDEATFCLDSKEWYVLGDTLYMKSFDVKYQLR